MDQEPHALNQPWTDLDALVEFVDDLRVDGYNVGVKEYLDVHQILLAAVARGADLSTPEQVSRLISPILCSSPDEQAEFSQRFGAWARQAAAAAERSAHIEKQPSLEQELREITWKDRMRWLPALLIFLVVTLLVGAGLAIRFGFPEQFMPKGATPDVQPAAATPGPTAGVQTPAAPPPTVLPAQTPAPGGQDLLQPVQDLVGVLVENAQGVRAVNVPAFWLAAALALLIVSLGMFVLRRLWYRYRAQLFLERRKSEETPDITRVQLSGSQAMLFDTAEMREVTRYFRRRYRAISRELDVGRTLAKTVKQGGWLTPIYADRQQPPEYVVLVSRSSFPDHLAHLVEAQLAVLRGSNVYLSIYYFDGTPQLCSAPSLHARPVTLAELASRTANQRLLIFGEAQVLLNPVSGEPADWARRLTAWPVRGLFTPAPPAEWGVAEQQAARVLSVWTALPEGLDLFIRSVYGEAGALFATDRQRSSPLPLELRTRPIRWLQPDPPPVDQVQRVLAGVRGYLGDWGFTWLCACAVYPQVNWNLTLFLGAMLGATQDTRSPIFHRTLLDLTRLPWFQYGVMPDWLRKILITGLQRDEEEQVRTALQGLLLTALDSPAGGFHLEIAQSYQTAVRKLVGSLLRLLSREAGPNSPLSDPVFLVFMGGHTRTQLAFQLPAALRSVFGGRGGGAGGTLAMPGRPVGAGSPAGGGARAGQAAPVRSPAGRDKAPAPVGRDWISSRTAWLLIGMTALALVIAFFTYPFLDAVLVPVRMSGNLNIAVSDFAEIDANGRAQSSGVGSTVGRTIYEALTDLQTGEVDTTQGAMIWHNDKDAEDRRSIFGAMPAVTDASAADMLAIRINADVVIYGKVVARDGAQLQVVPAIYFRHGGSDPEFENAAGTLSVPIGLAADGGIGGIDQANLAQLSRSLFWLVEGQAWSQAGDPGKALQAFRRLQAEQQGLEGEEGAWELTGRELLRLRDYAGAIDAFNKVLSFNAGNPFGRLQLARAYIEQATAAAAEIAGLPAGTEQCRVAFSTPPMLDTVPYLWDLQRARQLLAAAASDTQAVANVPGYRAAVQLLGARALFGSGWFAALIRDRQNALQQLASADALLSALPANSDTLGLNDRVEAQFTLGRIRQLRAELELQAGATAEAASDKEQAAAAYQQCAKLGAAVDDKIVQRNIVQCGCQAYNVEGVTVAGNMAPVITLVAKVSPATPGATATPGPGATPALPVTAESGVPTQVPTATSEPTALPALPVTVEPGTNVCDTVRRVCKATNNGTWYCASNVVAIVCDQSPTAAPPTATSAPSANAESNIPAQVLTVTATLPSSNGLPVVDATTPANNGVVVNIVETGPGTMSDVLPGLLTFQAAAFDSTVGKANGDGIDHVDFTVLAADGTPIYSQRELSAEYCAFGGSPPTCITLAFADSQNRWPDGTQFTPGQYTLRAEAFTPDGRSALAETTVNIVEPAAAATLPTQSGSPGVESATPAGNEVVVEIVETGRGTMSDVLLGLLTFQATAYDSKVGKGNGDGIDHVDLTVLAADGTAVYTRRELNLVYCAFANGGPACNTYVFANNQNRWPDGTQFAPGQYILRAEAFTPDGRSALAETTVTIVDPAATATETASAAATASKTYVNVATDFCLDSNGEGKVYALTCNGGNYQHWTQSGNRRINVSTGFCLDSNAQGDVYTLPCNDGSYQNWLRVGDRRINEATGRCLDSNAQGNVYTLPCNGGNYQNWR